MHPETTRIYIAAAATDEHRLRTRGPDHRSTRAGGCARTGQWLEAQGCSARSGGIGRLDRSGECKLDWLVRSFAPVSGFPITCTGQRLIVSVHVEWHP